MRASPRPHVLVHVCFNGLSPSIRVEVPGRQALSVLGSVVSLTPGAKPDLVCICRLSDNE